MESKRAWVRRNYVNFSANSENLPLLHKLLDPIVHFGANLQVLVISVHHNTVDVHKIGLSAIFRVPNVVLTVIFKTIFVGQAESDYFVLILYHQREETIVKEILHFVLRH